VKATHNSISITVYTDSTVGSGVALGGQAPTTYHRHVGWCRSLRHGVIISHHKTSHHVTRITTSLIAAQAHTSSALRIKSRYSRACPIRHLPCVVSGAVFVGGSVFDERLHRQRLVNRRLARPAAELTGRRRPLEGGGMEGRSLGGSGLDLIWLDWLDLARRALGTSRTQPLA